jgi:sulfate permease, SulP family
MRRREFWIAAVTCLTVAFVGVEHGVVLAIVISLIDHLRVSYRPPTRLLTLSASGGVAESPVSSRAMALPGLFVYRFEAPIYYANADYFLTQALNLTQASVPPVRWFVVRFDSISDVDYSGGKMLLDLASRLRERKVTMVLTDVKDDDRALLQRYGIIAQVGAENVFVHFPDAINAYKTAYPTSS